MDHEKVNILLVDDQPAKLLAYEVILKELGENLVVASSGREALEYLLKNEVAIILVDVCMPELDRFELAAMILVEVVARQVPGVLGDQDSAASDSFSNGLLEYPQYTRPAEFEGQKVPEVLLSGNHELIRQWRQQMSMERTRARRPGLLSGEPRPAGAAPQEVATREGGTVLEVRNLGGQAQEAMLERVAVHDDLVQRDVALDDDPVVGRPDLHAGPHGVLLRVVLALAPLDLLGLVADRLDVLLGDAPGLEGADRPVDGVDVALDVAAGVPEEDFGDHLALGLRGLFLREHLHLRRLRLRLRGREERPGAEAHQAPPPCDRKPAHGARPASYTPRTLPTTLSV